ncbi:Ig-like domain-containing protein [Microbacterium suwonense]|uniref:SbsA Ig-like domain-containing protein n=1 Tax=Microbacterium suwonense TaxID=683047 RepID=A0ABN6X622_9MICO|nr:Ig-like domain-containing protein [Microbacterium suwonense]BDZ40099.1 hypothetical protein GCM10025863_27130 [Microbacterium suwonense]
MSTDGSGEPLTRAQLRALRAAEEAAREGEQAAAPAEQGVESAVDEAEAQHPVPPVPVPATPVAVGITVPDLDASAPADPGDVPGADTPDVGPIRGKRPASGVSAPDSHPPRRPRSPGSRRFTATLLSVLGVLVLVVGVLGAVSLTQGPRVSAVNVDAAQTIATSGSRLTLTLNQPVAAIDPAQVSVQPAVPFTIDAAGRSIGIRFTTALDDETTYSISVTGVRGASGGPASDLTTSFTTPASRILLLQRSADGDDKIFRTDLSGERATPVFAHPRIDDYRATSNRIVVAVEDDDGSRLIVMDRDGTNQRELPLPGDGYVSSVQVSDRGGFVGYSYSDRELTETTGRASVLVTQSLSGEGEPRVVQVAGEDASIAEWQFVPGSSSLLFIDFDGALGVEDPSTNAEVKSMGVAAGILGISRGTYTAIVERTDGSTVQLDLTDGTETPLPASDPDYGDADTIVPYPGGTLRHVVQRDESGMPTGQAVVRVNDDGAADVIREVSGADAILQTCVSPSGQYAAVVVAPDLPTNAYDDLLLPLPSTLHTQLIDLSGKRALPNLNGFDISWCEQAPQP